MEKVAPLLPQSEKQREEDDEASRSAAARIKKRKDAEERAEERHREHLLKWDGESVTELLQLHFDAHVARKEATFNLKIKLNGDWLGRQEKVLHRPKDLDLSVPMGLATLEGVNWFNYTFTVEKDCISIWFEKKIIPRKHSLKELKLKPLTWTSWFKGLVSG